jgi:hypothetical protein
MFKLRYLAELTLFSTCLWMVNLDCSGVLLQFVKLCICPGGVASAINLHISVTCPDLVV